MRRPLCMMCLAFVVIVFGILQLLGRPPKPPEDLGGRYLSMTGRVCQKENKNDNSVIYLDQISWEEHSRISEDSYLQSLHHSKVVCYIEGEFPKMGSRVQVEGKVRLFEEATNPGEFDAEEYYQIMGTAFQLQGASIRAVSKSYDWHKEALYGLREGLWEILESCLPEKEAGILGAMMLGKKEALDMQMKDLYRRSGISHILAISGLHITLLGMGFYKGMRRLSAPVWLSAGLSILLMCEYGQMTGLGTSTLRAVMMFSLHLSGQLFGRTYDLITAAALSCVLLLCTQPLYLYHSGFLLSFGAVMGIGLVSQPLQVFNPWSRKEHPQLSKLGAAFLSGLGIQLATLPILLSTFYEYPVYSILLNLIVVPLMGMLFVDGLIGLAAGAVYNGMGVICLMPSRMILWLYETLAEMTGRLPGNRLITGHPQAWQTVIYYLLLVTGLCLLSWEAIQRRKTGQESASSCARMYPVLCRGGCVMLAVFGMILITGSFGRPPLVTMLDIGQGDACVIQTSGGRAAMIDAGSSSKKNIGKYQILPYLKYYGIDSLEAVFITHMDADHMNGVQEMMETAGQEGITIEKLVVADYAVKDEALYGMLRLARENGIKVLGMEEGDRIGMDEVEFTCLYPGEASRDGDRNNASLVLKIQAGEWSGIFMGDLGSEMEPAVMEKLAAGEKFDLLKVGHHGSNTSTCREFLDAVRPRAGLISCGKKNSYGHPGKDTLTRLEQAGCKVLITAQEGALEIRVREDGRMSVHLGK